MNTAATQEPTMSTIQTVRRNTKRYQRILETATDCKVYSLRNYFIAEECNPLALAEYMGTDGRFRSLHSRLTTSNNGETYTLHVHSNCWFEFRAAA
jgi:hypothetical protein